MRRILAWPSTATVLDGNTPMGYMVAVAWVPRWGMNRRSVMTTSEYRVSGVDVSARTGRMVVTSSAPIDQEAVLGVVDEAGYEAVLVA
jgi:hypothetical protein